MIMNGEVKNGLLMLLESMEIAIKSKNMIRFPLNISLLKENIVNAFVCVNLTSCAEQMKKFSVENEKDDFLNWISSVKKIIVLHERKAGAIT